MEKYVITISRQFGSMGRSIAQKLSNILEIDFLDRDIVEMTSKRMGLPVSMISNEEEAVKAGFLGRIYPLGVGIPSIKDEIFEVQSNIIKDYVKKGSCIIVGRCAEYILKDEKNSLNVYIYAPYKERIKNCTGYLGMEEKDAKRLIREVDTARENYHKLYVPQYNSPFDNRDLCIDSSKYGINGTAEIIAGIVNERMK
ncbi:MAG: cytidylate kinase-like family protein [Lachnospiraceae bacterium]|nr:cytidylate kinase-like family protein [Lachnospiraceae bacterium]